MDDKQLKEYARKCYLGLVGYSLEKARTLAPGYFPKIAYYYQLYLAEDTKKLNESVLRNVGLREAQILYNEVKSQAFEQLKLNRLFKVKLETIQELPTGNTMQEKLHYLKVRTDLMTSLFNSWLPVVEKQHKLLLRTVDVCNKYGYSDFAGMAVGLLDRLLYMNRQINKAVEEEHTRSQQIYETYEI